MSQWCNAYGAENPGGMPTAFGGLLNNPISTVNVCKTPATHRFRWVCEHGHQGSIVSLCEQHYGEFNGLKSVRGADGHTQVVPWNVRRNVQACPRCAAEAPTPEEQHKCAVRLVTVS